jgi:stage II sporulation protein D
MSFVPSRSSALLAQRPAQTAQTQIGTPNFIHKNNLVSKMVTFGLGMLAGLAMVLPAAPAKAVELRVKVEDNSSQFVAGSSTPGRVLDASGQPVANLQPLQGFAVRAAGGNISFAGARGRQLWLEPGKGGYVYIGNRWYRGRLQLIGNGSGVTAINHINLESYLASVVGKEMYPQWPAAALQAQVVAARSYAMSRREQQVRRGAFFDVGDTISHQVYTGMDGEYTTTQAAVRATRGQVLTYQGAMVEAVFHAASGGHTENSEDVWSKALPYLRGVPDFDQLYPTQQWTVSFTRDQMRQRFPGVGNVITLQPVRTSAQGRVIAVQVVGDKGSQTMTGSEIRRALGLRSTLFTVAPQMGLMAAAGDNAPRTPPQTFTITGRGHGHGLGLSQWGALGMAQQGKNYQQILQHYFRGTTLQTLPSVE